MAIVPSPSPTAWCRLHQPPSLVPGTIHVWRASLARAAFAAPHVRGMLVAEEMRRAERYRFARDRVQFMLTRALLRIFLGHYLDSAPSQIPLTYGPSGKPEVLTTSMRARLCFNVSRSDGVALYAFALDRQVGIDVERIRPDVAAEMVAEHFFSPSEVATLRGLPPSSQAQVFFDGWTRKEAYAKATGLGIGEGFGETMDLAGWSVCALDPAPGYAAALVAEGHDWHLERYDSGLPVD
jgi:4'-phosphopantetheinyl transferase